MRKPAALASTLLVLACGAQDTPSPPPRAQPQKCQSIDALAPALMETLEGGNAEKLRVVLERERLWDDQPDGRPSPVITLLRVVIGTLRSMAEDPAEAGAPEGQLCNLAKPPAAQDSNRICEARRVLEVFVREGKGIEAVNLLDPFIANFVGYVTGAGLEPPHYEVAQVFAKTCTMPKCSTEDMLGMWISLLAFLEPTGAEPDRPHRILAQLHELLAEPGIAGLMEQANSLMGEAELVAFGNLLIDNIEAMPDEPGAFVVHYHRSLEVKLNDLFTTTLKMRREDPKWSKLRGLLDALIGAHELADLDKPHGAARPLLMDLLDPARKEALLPLLQRQLNCLQSADPESATLRMLFALMYKQDVIGLEQVIGALDGIAALDDRMSLLTFLKRTLEMIRNDEEGIAAARKLCAVMLDTRPPAADGGATSGRSNAEYVLPIAADLFEGGVFGEVLCVTDSLLYGCASGVQPACVRP